MKAMETKPKYEYNLDKVKGCLVGGAAGDALGYPVEFRKSYAEIRERYGPQGITRYKLDDHDVAEVSDDTQMTLFTATGLLAAETELAWKHFGDDRSFQYNVGCHYIDWYWTQTSLSHKRHSSWLYDVPQLHARRGPGRTCMNSLHNLVDGVGDTNDSSGCGGVMRVAPVALSRYLRENRSRDFMYMLAGKTADITHHHPLGFMPAAMQVMLLDKISCYDGTIDRFALEKMVWSCLEELPDVRTDYDDSQASYRQFPQALQEMERLIRLAIELSFGGGRPDVECIERIGGGWTGDVALAIAVYCALRHTNSFEDAIVAAVNHGGDSDSTGSICGNIMGLIHGYDAIPKHFKTFLELRDVIEEVSEDLYLGTSATPDPARWRRKYLQGKRG